MTNSRKLFTYQLTNDTFTVSPNDGFTRFSIYNSTATAGSYIGSATSNGIASTAISVAQNETAVIEMGNAYVIEYLLITAPAGCTLKLMGS
jgi:hypothetical protein